MRVFKYELNEVDDFSLNLPQGAEILTVQVQGKTTCIWARVNPDAPIETRNFFIAGTGHEVKSDWEYIGTYQLFDGVIVFHLFEK